MKYIYWIFLLIFLVPPCNHLQAYSTTDTLHIYVEKSKPYAYANSSGETVGVLIDLVDSLFYGQNMPYNVVMKDALNSDFIGSYPCSITPQIKWAGLPEDAQTYSKLLFHTTAGVLHAQDMQMHKLSDIHGYKISVNNKPAFLHEMQTYGVDINERLVSTHSTIDQALDALTTGKSDYIIDDYLSLYWHLENEDIQDVYLVEVKTVPNLYKLHISSKYSAEFIQRVDQILQRKATSGAVDRVFNKWFGYPNQERVLQTENRLHISLLFIPVLVILLFWGIRSLMVARKNQIRIFEEFTDILMALPHAVDIYIDGSDISSYSNKKSLQIAEESFEGTHDTSFQEEHIHFTYKGKDIRVVVRIDVTELEAARKAADKASEVKTRFLANTSHDLRSPLNAIVGFAALLSECEEEDEVEEYVQIIEVNTHNLLRLLDSIIELSRLQSGIELQFNKKRNDFYRQLNRIHKEYELHLEHIGKSQVDLKLTTNFDQLVIWADAAHVHRVITNLLSNACKYTHEGYIHMDVRFEPKTKTIYFSVKDTGMGMTEEKLKALFTDVDVHDRTQENSFGFGLAICKTIVDHVHGDIEVHSTPGVGTSVDIVYRPKIMSYHMKE